MLFLRTRIQCNELIRNDIDLVQTNRKYSEYLNKT